MQDDPSTVPDSDTAYRRVPHSEAFIDWDRNLKRWIPLNAALRDPGGGREVSIYLHSFFAETEGPDDVASASPGSVAFAANAGGARSLGFGLTHRPDQDTGPLRHAHGCWRSTILAICDQQNPRSLWVTLFLVKL